MNSIDASGCAIICDYKVITFKLSHMLYISHYILIDDSRDGVPATTMHEKSHCSEI